VHLLIATDGSEDAIAAARRALLLLVPADVVTFVCVVEAPAEASSGLESGFAGGVLQPDEVNAAWAEAQTDARAALERTAGELDAPGSVQLVVEFGAPGPILCDLAKERAADAIVIGSRGLGAFKRALLGSVSSHVVHNAPCPVVVVRAQP
jgi:nucleotide-binding universal stress UspA family protein